MAGQLRGATTYFQIWVDFDIGMIAGWPSATVAGGGGTNETLNVSVR